MAVSDAKWHTEHTDCISSGLNRQETGQKWTRQRYRSAKLVKYYAGSLLNFERRDELEIEAETPYQDSPKHILGIAENKAVARRKTVKKQIVYVSPPRQVIDQYVRDVCQELGQKLDPEFNTAETRHELANFLNVVSTFCAKDMNRRN